MWSNETQYTQWALNPSAYQNISHEEIDWAALAQQWIQMKETNVSQVPPAPPPPSLRDSIQNDIKKNVEGGEAPMDVDNNKEELSNSNTSNSEDTASWNTWSNWQQWGWNWGNSTSALPSNVLPTPTPPALGKPIPPTPAPPLPGTVPSYTYTASQPSAGMFDYNHTQSAEEYNQVVPGNYWPGGTSSTEAVSPSGTNVTPAPFLRQNRQNDWRRDNRLPDRDRIPEKSAEEEDTTTLIDAAKRRQLPAWIREGLEKMEREKQKKFDKERQIKEREEYLQNKKKEEEIALNELNKLPVPSIPKKSKFDSDSDEETVNKSPASPHTSVRRKSRFRDSDSPPAIPLTKQPMVEEKPTLKSREEMMQEVMLNVRRTLTEVLLEVTTEEMLKITQEVLYKAKSKAPATQLRKTQALTSLTGKLGLGIYGDSEDSDSGESSSGNGTPRKESTPDSDEELKVQISRKKQNFVKTEREIEAHLKMEEDREMEREKSLAAKENYNSHPEREAERQVEKQIDSKQAAICGGSEVDSKQEKKDSSEEYDYKRQDTTAITDNNGPRHVSHDKTRSHTDFHKEDNTLKIPTVGNHSSSSEDETSSSPSDDNDDDEEKNEVNEENTKDYDHSGSKSSTSSSSESQTSSKKSSRNNKNVERKHSKYKQRSRSRESQYKSARRQSGKYNVSEEFRRNKEDDNKKRYKRDKISRSRSRSKSKRHRSRSRETDRKRHYNSSRSRSERYRNPSHSSKQNKKVDDRRPRRKRSDSDSSSSKHYSNKRDRRSRSRSRSHRKKSRHSRGSSSSSQSPYSSHRFSGKRSQHSRYH